MAKRYCDFRWKAGSITTGTIHAGWLRIVNDKFLLKFGNEDLTRDLVNNGVPEYPPEIILPNSSLSLSTNVAVAILNASTSPVALNSFRIS